jgi:hypothetical protein
LLLLQAAAQGNRTSPQIGLQLPEIAPNNKLSS